MKVRGQGFARLNTVKDAQKILNDKISQLNKTEVISTLDINQRVLAEDIIAPNNLPGYRRAAMDGFAIIAEDSYMVTATSPKRLSIIEHPELGTKQDIEISPGQAIQVSTGKAIPTSATAVIRLEDCEILQGEIEIYTSIPQGRNISDEDEDVQEGKIVLKSHTKLRPWDIGLLLSLGIDKVRVISLPSIGILSTGDELLSIGETQTPGYVIDSNRPAIISWISAQGGNINISKRCGDDPGIIKEEILSMAEKVDLIITIGGTSVGEKDYLAEVIDTLGELWVHGVAMRPGKPLALGCIEVQGKCTPIISLPGYPLAAFLNFHLFIAPLLERWTGVPGLLSKKTKVRLADRVASKVGSRDFVRLKETPNGAKVIRISGSGILSSLIEADYLLDIPYDLEGYNPGEVVEVFQLR